METIFLRGGLGNQFYQWVYALALQESGAPVCLDSSFVRKVAGNQALGEVELSKLFVDLRMPVTARFTRVGAFEPVFVRVAHAVSALQIEHRRKWLPLQPRLHYGYYQTGEYYSSAVAQAVSSRMHPGFSRSSNPLLPPQLVGSRYAAVHLRGGDYSSSGYNRTELGLLSTPYYREALARLSDSGLPIVVVSDDPPRARKIIDEAGGSTHRQNILHLDGISPNSSNPLVALSVMLAAERLVCANSSFSAMSGFLNQGADIYYPYPWFRGKSLRTTAPVLSKWHPIPAAFEA